MTVGGITVASATVHNDNIKVQWHEPAWEKWEDLQRSPEMAQLADDARKKLPESAARKAKGMGKGKPGKGD